MIICSCDFYHNLDDCNDTNPDINPNAEEIPNNDIDEDCGGIDMVTSIHEISNSIINIYPNPAMDLINIDVVGEIKFKVTIYESTPKTQKIKKVSFGEIICFRSGLIYNLEGKMMLTSSNASSIQIQSLPHGIYIFELQNLGSGQKFVKRMVKGN